MDKEHSVAALAIAVVTMTVGAVVLGLSDARTGSQITSRGPDGWGPLAELPSGGTDTAVPGPTATYTGGRQIAALVNGSPLFTETLLARIDVAMDAGSFATSAEACDAILTQMITSVLTAELLEEMEISVTEDELATAEPLFGLDSMMTRYPDYAEAISESIHTYLDTIGMSQQDYEEAASAFAEQTLLLGVLAGAVADNVPTPTSAEVQEYLVSRQNPSEISLMTMTYSNREDAQAAWEVLYTQYTDGDSTPFAERFLAYAIETGQIPADYTNPTEYYSYTNTSQLPDYVQAAVDGDPGALGLGRHGQPDGPEVIFLVLSRTPPLDALVQEEHARQQLMATRVAAYLHQIYADTYADAVIEVFTDCSMQ